MSANVKWVKNNIGKVINAISAAELNEAVRDSAQLVRKSAIINIGNTFIDTHGTRGLGSIAVVKGKTKPNRVLYNVGPTVIYGRIHELGGTIKPVRKKWLTFRTKDGQWRKVAQVTMPKRPYLEPALTANLENIKALTGSHIEAKLIKACK